MPEGVEVRIMMENLRPMITGKTITAAAILGGKWRKKLPKNWPQFIADLPQRIMGVGRHGKLQWITLENKTVIAVGLGMTGKLKITSNNTPQYGFIKFNMDGEDLYYIDSSQKGNVAVLTLAELAEKRSKLGIDIFSLPRHDAGQILVAPTSRSPIAAILLSQQWIAGAGAYIIADALYLARVHPLAKSLNQKTIDVVVDAIVRVAETSYAARSAGKKYIFVIYGRKTKKDAAGNPIEKVHVRGRNIRFVPAIQKLPTV